MLEIMGVHNLELLNIVPGTCRGNQHGPRHADSVVYLEAMVGDLRVQVHLCRRCLDRSGYAEKEPKPNFKRSKSRA
jgi:sulfur relay (sulfurtransferase) complex TusBCD TusD component (DsrE family)